ncbi:MAG: ATP-binding protein [Saprospiraceae bacterium]
MTDNIKIIQDICLLYELSLSVGSSLDARENCKQFLHTLISRKSLNFASVWLHKTDVTTSYCELFFITPSYRANTIMLKCSNPILEKLRDKPYLSINSNEPEFEEVVTEKNVDKGAYAIFRLGNIGFLKLFSSTKQDGFGNMEMAQLKNVVDKFAISLEGCLAHAQLKDEIINRQITQVRLTNLITNLQAGVLLENEDRKIILTNNQFCKIFNIPYSPDEMVGLDCSQAAEQSKHLFKNPEQFVEEINNRLKDRKLVVGETLEMADGRFLERDYVPLFSGESYLGHQWQYRDVTETRQVQKSILESEEKYRGIIENMELGLLEVDTEHTILRPYKHFCDMLGFTAEELIGQNALELFVTVENQKIFTTHDKFREKGQTSVYEVQLRRKDGSTIWALISGAPIRDSNGQVIGSIGVHYDLTSRKQLEHDLADAKRIADQARLAERQFLANMSHEIRTPMNSVIGMTHLLYETNPTSSQKEYLDSLRFSADSLLGIIDNVLDLSKIEAGELGFEEKHFDLEQLLKSLRRTYQFKVKDKPISVVLEFDPDIQNLVIGDPTRLNQILSNLLSNASKFTERGTISLAARLLLPPDESYQIEFKVQDTGIGIAQGKTKEIFQNFKQADINVARKYGGTGLGLAIVKQLVELQGGQIRVESKLHKGSTFVFTLPLKNSGTKVAAKKEDFATSYPNTRSHLKDLDILVAEDNWMNQRLITKVLETWGCRFRIACNGSEAVQFSQAKKYDLILMDVNMPEMDGVEAAQIIRTNGQKNPNQSTPIIALTAAALLEEKKRALEAGMNDFLTRPFSPNMLENSVARVLDLQSAFSAEGPIATPPKIKVDLQYLFDFSSGDRLFVRDMLEAFVAEVPRVKNNLSEAVSNKNWEEIYKIIHKLKSNFMMFGMTAQQENIIEMEELIKNGEAEKPELIKKVQQLSECLQSIAPILEKQKSLL